jgi:transcription elongation factor GreA
MTEARVKVLEGQLSRATVINVSELSGETVTFGATVMVLDEETEEKKQFQIVGEMEADATNGKISITSPIARALIGKEVGDSIELNTPGGERYYEILEISFI